MTKGKVRFWRSVFRRVLTKYDDLKSVHGSGSCTNFYRAFGHTNDSVPCSKVVKVLPEEFFADVELAARRALSCGEWEFFKNIYLDKNEKYEENARRRVTEEAHIKYKHRIQEKVGKILADKHIYPVERYFLPIDLR